MLNRFALLGLMLLVLVSLGVVGCKKATIEEEPDYSRPLPPGAKALRKITDPAKLPDLTMAFNTRDSQLLTAADRSVRWFRMASTPQFYPSNDITHEQAWASVYAFRQILASSQSAGEFQSRIRAEFDTYESVGWNDKGDVLFTGYFTPIFRASPVRNAEYQYPIYPKPADLLIDKDGKFVGRDMGGGRVNPAYPTRAQIDAYPDRLGLAGREIAWMRDRFERYILQVNGSGRLDMPNGTSMYVGYAGYNGYDYKSIGRMLVEEGKISKNKLNLPAIKAYFAAHPDEVDGYLNRNDRYVFFREYTNENWPAGSLGFQVTPMRSLATDKSVFPRGCMTLVSTTSPDTVGTGMLPFQQFMLDQDTGGAIRAAGRGDIYMGVGDAAEALAGRQVAEGRLYYFFLRPERVGAWAQQVRTVH